MDVHLLDFLKGVQKAFNELISSMEEDNRFEEDDVDDDEEEERPVKGRKAVNGSGHFYRNHKRVKAGAPRDDDYSQWYKIGRGIEPQKSGPTMALYQLTRSHRYVSYDQAREMLPWLNKHGTHLHKYKDIGQIIGSMLRSGQLKKVDRERALQRIKEEGIEQERPMKD